MSWALKPSCFSFRAFDPETKIRLIEGLLNPQITVPGTYLIFASSASA